MKTLENRPSTEGPVRGSQSQAKLGNRDRDSTTRLAIALVLAAALLYCTGLYTIDLWAPDEPRYGQIAEEVRALSHGPESLFLLRFNGEAYTQKPPLYYWLAAGFARLVGADSVSESLARLPSALSGVAVIALTLLFGRRLFANPSAALWSAALLASVYRFASSARRAQLDILLTLLETLALFCFWKLERSDSAGRIWPTVLALHVCLGLAALVKGPVGWLPLLIIAGYLGWEGRLRDLRRIVPVWALLASVGPVLVWISIATWLAPAGFFEAAVIDNVARRFLAAASHVRGFYYFLYQLPADFMPWTLLFPLAFAAIRTSLAGTPETRRPWRLLVLWLAIPFIIFSISSGKRGIYLLPCFPAIALLCGAAVDDWLQRHASLPRWLLVLLGTLGLSLAVGSLGAAWLGGIDELLEEGFRLTPFACLLLGGTATLGLLAGGLATRAAHPAGPLAIAIATLFLLEAIVFQVVFPGLDDQKSPRPIADVAAALSDPDETIGVFDDEGLAGGIVYYGHRRVEILPRPAQVDAFFESGGRLMVLERWKIYWLDDVGRFEVLDSRREGRRELAIVRRTRRVTSESPSAP